MDPMPAAAPAAPEPGPHPGAKTGAQADRPEATLAETRALAHPLRLRIIRLLSDRSLTNRELARALGEHPATVLHHVRTLLRNDFIAAEPERRGPRGTIEKPYRSTGRSWALRIEDDHGVAQVAGAALDAFLAELREAQPSADELEARIDQVLREYAALAPDPDGEPWGVFVATHRRAPFAPDEHPVTAATAARRQMPPEVQLVDRAPDDDTAILLVRAQWAELSARYGVPEADPASISNPAAFRPPSGAFVGLSVAGEAAGCGGVCRFRDPEDADSEDGEPIGELKGIYVAPLHRGHGYGRLIVQALEARAARIGYRALRLETGDAQPEAMALYPSLGYTQIERYGPYRDLVRSVCFERALEP
jgi:GNAT superfamily N-acetyltransferase